MDRTTFTEANTQRITVDARLEESIAETTAALATKADAEAVATRHPLITAEAPLSLSLVHGLVDALNTASTSAVIQDGELSIAKTSGLQGALDARATVDRLNNSLSSQQDLIGVDSLPIDRVQGLAAALANKLSSLSDAPGNGSSLVASGSQIRKVVGTDGVDVSLNFTPRTAAPPANCSSAALPCWQPLQT